MVLLPSTCDALIVRNTSFRRLGPLTECSGFARLSRSVTTMARVTDGIASSQQACSSLEHGIIWLPQFSLSAIQQILYWVWVFHCSTCLIKRSVRSLASLQQMRAPCHSPRPSSRCTQVLSSTASTPGTPVVPAEAAVGASEQKSASKVTRDGLATIIVDDDLSAYGNKPSHTSSGIAPSDPVYEKSGQVHSKPYSGESVNVQSSSGVVGLPDLSSHPPQHVSDQSVSQSSSKAVLGVGIPLQQTSDQTHPFDVLLDKQLEMLLATRFGLAPSVRLSVSTSTPLPIGAHQMGGPANAAPPPTLVSHSAATCSYDPDTLRRAVGERRREYQDTGNIGLALALDPIWLTHNSDDILCTVPLHRPTREQEHGFDLCLQAAMIQLAAIRLLACHSDPNVRSVAVRASMPTATPTDQHTFCHLMQKTEQPLSHGASSKPAMRAGVVLQRNVHVHVIHALEHGFEIRYATTILKSIEARLDLSQMPMTAITKPPFRICVMCTNRCLVDPSLGLRCGVWLRCTTCRQTCHLQTPVSSQTLAKTHLRFKEILPHMKMYDLWNRQGLRIDL
jgi:hypothetical protein